MSITKFFGINFLELKLIAKILLDLINPNSDINEESGGLIGGIITAIFLLIVMGILITLES